MLGRNDSYFGLGLFYFHRDVEKFWGKFKLTIYTVAERICRNLVNYTYRLRCDLFSCPYRSTIAIKFSIKLKDMDDLVPSSTREKDSTKSKVTFVIPNF